MYTLDVEKDGSGILKVTSGWVALQSGSIESLIPANAVCRTEKSFGPGTPYFEDASEEFKEALSEFDFGKNKREALAKVLQESREKDALSLWHILQKTIGDERELTLSKLDDLVELPEGVTVEGILKGDRQMMDHFWESLGYGSKSLWNNL
jgi:hypothetical protein